ncbi:MAG: hypothetical protein NUV31_07310 [Dehalococcoidales bacterium]|jgi:hypothetical protein|nr:hypothetical protein [Dehalococcoidales bacterium]
MSAQIDKLPQKTARPVIAGVLSIIAGAICLVGVLVFSVIAGISTVFGGAFVLMPVLFFLMGIPALALGVISITGGVYATQRRRWGWALAGSITALIISNVLGIVAIILVAIAREEFTG